MSSPNLVWWGGIAAVVSGLMYVVIVLLNPQGLTDDPSIPGPLATVMFFVALLGQLAGIASLHVLQRERYGRLGKVGFLAFVVGIVFLILFFAAAALFDDIPVVLTVVLILVGVFAPLVGLVLLGLATLRTRMLPSWFGVLLIIGLPVAVLLGVVLGALAWWIAFGIFWILVGYALLSSGTAQVTHPTG